MKKILFFFFLFITNVLANNETLKELYKEYCLQGNKHDGCTLLGIEYLKEGKIKKGMFYLDKLCIEYPSADNCNMVGAAYFFGYIPGTNIKTFQDFNKAVKFSQKACKLGSGEACNNVGVAYMSGKGVKKNINKAEEYYKKACNEYSYGLACKNLAGLYLKKHKVYLVLYYLKKACKLGNEKSCNILNSIPH